MIEWHVLFHVQTSLLVHLTEDEKKENQILERDKIVQNINWCDSTSPTKFASQLQPAAVIN